MTTLAASFIAFLTTQPACTVDGMVPRFWPKVISVESHGDPWALHDDTEVRSYYPASAEAAASIARRLWADHHSVGIGLSQLTASSPSEFWGKFHLTLPDALEPCPNLHAAAQHYVDGALSIYNSGSPTKALAYAAKVQAVRDDTPGKEPPPPPPEDDPDDGDMHDAVHVHRTFTDHPKDPT